jgi:hypothetical protein
MTTKFVCPSQIHSTSLNGDPLVATRFNCRRSMANKMDLVLATRWEPKPFWSPPLDGAWERRNMANPLLLLSVPHKDGGLKKIWSPSNRHFVCWSKFFSCQKRGPCHMFLKTFWQLLSFPKTYDKPPFVVTKNNSVPIWKIVTLGWVIKEI